MESTRDSDNSAPREKGEPKESAASGGRETVNLLKNRPLWQRLLAALLIVAAASAIRKVFFASLGEGIPFLFFYPAVLLAALFGGLLPGLLATVLSAGFFLFWIEQDTILPDEWLNAGVFSICCTAISFVCEVMLRSQTREKLAREEAETSLQQLQREMVLRQQADTNNSRLAAIVESSEDAIIGEDLNDIITDWNRGAEKMFGHTAGEMVGTSIRRLIPEEQLEEEDKILEQIRRGESVQHYETIRRARDGRRLEVSITTSPIKNSAGKIIGISKTARDITERKRAESDLSDSEERFRRAMVDAPFPIMLHAENGAVLQVSNSWCEITGYSREELATTADWTELAYGERKILVQAEIDALYGVKQRKYEGDYFIRTKSGARRIWEFSSAPLGRLADGRRVVISMALDATERREAESALRESELKFRSIINSSPVPMALNDEKQRINFLNPAFIHTFGYEPEDIPTLADWWPKAYPDPDYRQRVAESWQAKLEQSKRAGTPFAPLEASIRCKDGSERFVLVSTTTLARDPAGNHLVVFHDITERRKAEQEIQRQAAFARLNPNPVLELSATGEILYYNDAALQMAKSLGQESPARILPTNTAAIARECLATNRSNLRLETVEQGRTISWSFFPVAQNNAVHCYAGDITERKQAQMALAESEKNFRQLVQHMQVGLVEHGPDTRVIYCNSMAVQLLGLTLEQMQGKTAMDPAWKFIHEDGGHMAVEDYPVNRALRAEHKIVNDVIAGICRPDRKQPVWVQCNAHVNKAPDGQTKGVVVTFADLTERKQAEEAHARLAMAVEQAAETIVITDTEGVILYANPAFEKTTGYTHAEALGQNPRVLKSGKQDGAFYRQMWETLKRGDVWTGHFINKRKDGTLYEEEATISPIRDAAGKIINYVAVKRDVTHEVELEGQLRQSQKMEAIGTLAGGIAHDFNNILNVIFGYSNLLQMDLAGKKDELEKLGEILKAGERAKYLVQQILMFSRQREQERRVIQLNSIIKETAKLLRASLPANLQIETELAADAPMVLADATQIYQVIMNLGTNALHAMEKQTSGRLTIALDAFVPDAAFIQTHPELRAIKYARLTISDTGCGMDAKTLARIYDPFFTTKPVGKGTGLGLAVVHGIIESHDGVITVESQPGQGTSFRLYFPEQIQDMFQDGIPEALIPCGQGQRILMVDDEAVLKGMYQQLLRALKYEGTIVTDPEEAISLVRKNPAQFDMVITDLTMPKLSGLEVARQIREIRADMPVILATGFHGTVSDRQLTDAGICEVVEKPISMATLAMVLRGILGKKPEA